MFPFGGGTGVIATAFLAMTKWLLGEVGPARALIEEAAAHAIETGYVPTLVNTYMFKAQFEIVGGDAGAARRDARIVVKLSQENALIILRTDPRTPMLCSRRRSRAFRRPRNFPRSRKRKRFSAR
jgi:hypothetical protein